MPCNAELNHSTLIRHCPYSKLSCRFLHHVQENWGLVSFLRLLFTLRQRTHVNRRKESVQNTSCCIACRHRIQTWPAVCLRGVHRADGRRSFTPRTHPISVMSFAASNYCVGKHSFDTPFYHHAAKVYTRYDSQATRCDVRRCVWNTL